MDKSWLRTLSGIESVSLTQWPLLRLWKSLKMIMGRSLWWIGKARNRRLSTMTMGNPVLKMPLVLWSVCNRWINLPERLSLPKIFIRMKMEKNSCLIRMAKKNLLRKINMVFYQFKLIYINFLINFLIYFLINFLLINR